VRRALAKSLAVQTASLTDDGLQPKPTWVTTGTVTVQLMPASKTDVELAGLRGERVTHAALAPYGLALKEATHRLLDGATVFRISRIVSAPKNTVLVLEATT